MEILPAASQRVNAADPSPVRPQPRPPRPQFAPVHIDDVVDRLAAELGRIDGLGEYALLVLRQGVPAYAYVSDFDPDPNPPGSEMPAGVFCPTCDQELQHVGPGRFTCPSCAVRPTLGPDPAHPTRPLFGPPSPEGGGRG